MDAETMFELLTAGQQKRLREKLNKKLEAAIDKLEFKLNPIDLEKYLDVGEFIYESEIFTILSETARERFEKVVKGVKIKMEIGD